MLVLFYRIALYTQGADDHAVPALVLLKLINIVYPCVLGAILFMYLGIMSIVT